ncbi:MAG: TIGR04255 family protein [Pseudomonadota bacterium]
MNNTIPSFNNPPLNEVLLGVQYDSSEAFNLTTYGAIWDCFKEYFPDVQHHMPLEATFEKIGGRRQQFSDFPTIQLEQMTSPALPRAWFVSDDGRELIQLQPDRFIRNWRRADFNDEYPRYEKRLRPEFLSALNTLNNFYKKNGFGFLKPNQCEISYINHIDADKTHCLLSDVFLGWSNQYELSDIENININIKHIIKDSDSEFIGRLYIKVQPAFKLEEEKPIFLIELAIKGRPLGEGIEGVMSFMDMGREKIVRAFAKMTTKEMHDLWDMEVNK